MSPVSFYPKLLKGNAHPIMSVLTDVSQSVIQWVIPYFPSFFVKVPRRLLTESRKNETAAFAVFQWDIVIMITCRGCVCVWRERRRKNSVFLMFNLTEEPEVLLLWWVAILVAMPSSILTRPSLPQSAFSFSSLISKQFLPLSWLFFFPFW